MMGTVKRRWQDAKLALATASEESRPRLATSSTARQIAPATANCQTGHDFPAARKIHCALSATSARSVACHFRESVVITDTTERASPATRSVQKNHVDALVRANARRPYNAAMTPVIPRH